MVPQLSQSGPTALLAFKNFDPMNRSHTSICNPTTAGSFPNRRPFQPFRNGRSPGTLTEVPVTVAPLAWRIGMTAPVFERGLGPFLKTTRSVCDPLCLPLGLPCSFRPYWSGLSYRRMRHRLSQHVRRSVRPRWMAARFARSERVPGYIPAISPLRPLPPMESAIHDVYSHLNRPGCYGHEKSRRWVETATIYAYSRGNLIEG